MPRPCSRSLSSASDASCARSRGKPSEKAVVDLLAANVCVVFMRTMRLPSLRVGTILLSLSGAPASLGFLTRSTCTNHKIKNSESSKWQHTAERVVDATRPKKVC